jgi:hypothetical protein
MKNNDITFLDILAARKKSPKALHEASLGRVYQHVRNLNESSFLIISGWRAANTKKQNLEQNRKLAESIRSLNLGFNRLIGHWRECQDDSLPYDQCPPDQLRDSKEESFFVPNASLKQAKLLCKQFNQDAVVYGGPDVGSKIVLVFRDGSTQEIASKFTPNKISQAFSQVRGKSFVFEGFEYPAQTWIEKTIEGASKASIQP